MAEIAKKLLGKHNSKMTYKEAEFFTTRVKTLNPLRLRGSWASS
jgi:hypothetical protein